MPEINLVQAVNLALARAMAEAGGGDARAWGAQHMIPPERAAAARVRRGSRGFDEE